MKNRLKGMFIKIVGELWSPFYTNKTFKNVGACCNVDHIVRQKILQKNSIHFTILSSLPSIKIFGSIWNVVARKCWNMCKNKYGVS